MTLYSSAAHKCKGNLDLSRAVDGNNKQHLTLDLLLVLESRLRDMLLSGAAIPIGAVRRAG